MQGQHAKVIGISIKDRGAILPVGTWPTPPIGSTPRRHRWTTSSYYMSKLPAWAEEINRASPPKGRRAPPGTRSTAKPGDRPLCSMVAGEDDVRYCGSLEASPWGNEMIEEFAERAVVDEDMGQHMGNRRAGSQLLFERLRGPRRGSGLPGSARHFDPHRRLLASSWTSWISRLAPITWSMS